MRSGLVQKQWLLRKYKKSKIYHVHVPVLPRLKIFEILQSPTHFRKLNPNRLLLIRERTSLSRIGPGIFPWQSRKSDAYATHFPSLVRLELKNQVGSLFGDKSLLDDKHDFETWLSFLYSSFLPAPSPALQHSSTPGYSNATKIWREMDPGNMSEVLIHKIWSV